MDLENIKERVIIVAIDFDNQDTDDSLDELEELVRTAGAETVGRITQSRESAHPATYVGKGKMEEIKNLVIALGATGVICDDELSPAQLKNLQEKLDTKVMDRTMLILDIFAKRASTKEGIIQVELAQLRYRLTRLIGIGASLSRLGGGIGTRGPGEKKLEVDRRHIRNHIGQLSKELQEIKKHRDLIREQRKKKKTPVIAIVGYTNAGKSTLLNRLTMAGVLEEDKLFATLDPTTRQMELPSGKQVFLTDTVGFIRKLPHHLIKAFQSTLEEAKYADLLLHVVDSSSPQAEKHIHVVYQTLKDLEALDKPIITVYNKQDCLETPLTIRDVKAEKSVYISALKEEGIDELLNSIEEVLRNQAHLIEKIIPYNEGSILNNIRTYGQIEEEEYKNEGVYIKAYVPQEVYDRVNKLL
ncbi:GTP-binding protein HflX [Natranaerovirga pectinivora]|uniref:GTPase HflX n=1 Tax=Natranaerovirga pectinivora TaxID=682400 RepID=A0A4R3MJY2_9FIRM|nr:GTPase HflX [Natranaerovirga pectinivora]TCT14376.1 GTP-binding protein HflX [Natranaerovirga pectinivora]